MAHSNCGKRIKLSFIDLNSRINKYHTGVVQFQRAVCHHYGIHDWTSCLRERSVFSQTFYSSLHQMPYSQFLA